jgi:hypothetical protein
MNKIFSIAPLLVGICLISVRLAAIPVELVGQWGGACHAVAIRDDYAYIGRGPSLAIVDISRPAGPMQVGQVNLPDIAKGVVVNAEYAYVANDSAGLAVVDISNSSAPVLSGRCHTSGSARRVALSGSYACIADSDAGLVVLHVSWPGDLPPPDGDVDLSDLAQFAAHWLEASCIRPKACDGTDLDNDTDVDFSDLLIMGANWLQSPGPRLPPPRPTR